MTSRKDQPDPYSIRPVHLGKRIGERVGPNEIIALDGFVRRIESVATRKARGWR